MANFFTDRVNHDHGDEDDQEERGEVRVFLQGHGDPDFLAEAACADEADNGRRPDVDFEPQQRVADDVRNDLGDDAVSDLVEPGSAGSLDAFQRPHVCIFIGFGIELAERAGGMQANGKYAREWTDAKTENENQGPDEFRNRANYFQIAPGQIEHKAIGCKVPGGRKTEKKSSNHTEERCHIGNQDRFEKKLQPDLPAPEPVGNVGSERLPMEDRQGLVEIFPKTRQTGPDFPHGDPVAIGERHIGHVEKSADPGGGHETDRKERCRDRVDAQRGLTRGSIVAFELVDRRRKSRHGNAVKGDKG